MPEIVRNRGNVGVGEAGYFNVETGYSCQMLKKIYARDSSDWD